MFLLTKYHEDEIAGDILAVSTDQEALTRQADLDWSPDRALPFHEDLIDGTLTAQTPYHCVRYVITPVKEV